MNERNARESGLRQAFGGVANRRIDPSGDRENRVGCPNWLIDLEPRDLTISECCSPLAGSGRT
jgi:hypothetical protein